jgi:hypothetical protein
MNIRSVVLTARPPIQFGLAEWSADERTVMFKPQTPLSPGTRYTITVTGKDRAGNEMRPFSWSFTAAAPSGRSGSGEARVRGRVEARADERLFTFFAALNAAGYDAGVDESGSVRAAVRKKLGDFPLKIIEPFQKFQSQHRLPLEAYVSYVFTLGPPPEFAEARAPGDLDGLGRILADFYAGARIADLWASQKEAYDRTAASFASEAPPLFGRVIEYLRVADLPAPRLVLIPNLLDAPGNGFLIRQKESAVIVLGSSGTLERAPFIRLATDLFLSPLGGEPMPEVEATRPLFDLVKDVASRNGYLHWKDVIRGSLIGAVTARLAMPREKREEFLRDLYDKGLILVAHFSSELDKYEASTLPLTAFLPQMLRSVNVAEEQRKFATRGRP